jgi:hypothetical protein
VTTFGEGTAERARTATQVEDTTWPRSGEGEVEVVVLRPRVSEIVDLRELSMLIVHPFFAALPKPPVADSTGVTAKEWSTL